MGKKTWPIVLLLVAAPIVWLVRTYCCHLLLVNDGEGQRQLVLVDRMSYRKHPPRCGDWAVVHRPDVERGARPDTSRWCVAQVIALPGDTVWMGYGGQVSIFRSFRKGCIWPVMMPSRGQLVKMSPWSAALYARLIQTHEQPQACVTDTALCVDGRRVDYFRFTHDYYWLSSGEEDNFFDSRTYGPVPTEFFVGKINSFRP